MDYKSAKDKLQGRCYESRKLANNTYLKRGGWRPKGDIAVQLHSTDVITFHPNGDVTLNTGGWNTITTRDRINGFQSAARVYSQRNQLFAVRNADNPWTAPDCHKRAFDTSITITAKGKFKGGKPVADIKTEWRAEDREAARVSRWLSKARGMKVTTKCKEPSWRCDTRVVFGRRRSGPLTPGEYECGCIVERVQHKTKLTVAKIMAEPNITVRMAMAHIYGLERFLLEAGAETIDTHGEYALLDMPMGENGGWRRDNIRALKMTCPSTGAVYISPVDPAVRNVSQALDWYFQTEDYLKSVTQES